MRQFLFLLLFIFPSISAALDFEQADILIKNQWIKGNAEVSAYLEERMEYENSIRLDERGGCYGIPGAGFTQIVRINEEGVVDLVVSSSTGAKSECFQELYLGTEYEKPPKAPIFKKMMMGFLRVEGMLP